MNCRRTKRCVQCHTDRPTQYLTPPNSGSSPKGQDETQLLIMPSQQQQQLNAGEGQQLRESQLMLSRALNKWTCQCCTFDNWPTAFKCTICGQTRGTPREQSQSPPQQQKQQSAQRTTRKRSETPRLERQESGGAIAVERLDQMSIGGGGTLASRPEYSSALDIYVRRFLANDPTEKLFFKAAVAIGHRELQMVNRVVDYLINEGNLQRALNAFESRLLNQFVARSGQCRVVGFERADSLFYLAKKSDCLDLVKLIRRVRPEEDRLPCVLNCASRTCLYAKVTTQCMAHRDGGPGGALSGQFIAQPHNFCFINMPMPNSELSLAVQNALFRPAPSTPPQLCYLDCYDAMASQGGLIVGRPPNFLMRNRGGAHSLYDSVFQCMYGVCDRFNILRAATKYTMHKSAHLFKMRWLEHQLRMVRDCGISVSAPELDADWADILNSVAEEDECPELIHLWVLAHVCCRPIIVCPMDDPIDVDQLMQPPQTGRAQSPRAGDDQLTESSPTTGATTADGSTRAETIETPQQQEKNQRQNGQHIYEGIYLPLLWAHHSAPISRSPLLLTYRNGQFQAVIVSDNLYQRDQEVQRYLRLRRCVRRPGTGSDSPFRFLSRAELDNSALLAQFLLFGQCTAQQLSIRREPHSHLPESLQFYKNWMQAMMQLSSDQNVVCGTATAGQLESRMDGIAMGQQQAKKRKGSAALQQQQQQLQQKLGPLFSASVNQQLFQQPQQGRPQQQHGQLHPHAAGISSDTGGRSSSEDEEIGDPGREENVPGS